MSWICYVFVFKVYLYLCFSCGSLAGMQWSVWDGEPAPYRWITHCFKPPACQYTSRLLNPSTFCVFIWKSHVAVCWCLSLVYLHAIVRTVEAVFLVYPCVDFFICLSFIFFIPSISLVHIHSIDLFVCLLCSWFKVPWQNTNRRNTRGLCAGVFLCVFVLAEGGVIRN